MLNGMLTREEILEAFKAKELAKKLKEAEEERERREREKELSRDPYYKKRREETLKALLARLEAIEDRLRREEENRNRSFGLGAGNTDLTPHEWHEGLNYEQTLKRMMERGDILRR